jgi:hypothetical protein
MGIKSADEFFDFKSPCVSKCLQAMVELDEQWGMPDSQWALFLDQSRPGWADDDTIIDIARRHSFMFQAALRKAFREYDIFPLSAYALYNRLSTDDEKDKASEDACEHKCCWKPSCGQKIISLVGSDPTRLRSPFGVSMVETHAHMCDHQGVTPTERTHSLHKHWMDYQGQGHRPPRCLAIRHIINAYFEFYLSMNLGHEDAIRAALHCWVDSDKSTARELKKLMDDEQRCLTGRSGIGGNPKMSPNGAGSKPRPPLIVHLVHLPARSLA